MVATETKYFILDFDSTFTKVEALDELANIALEGSPEREKVVQQIAELTNRGMDGSISFRESLEKRVALLHANRSHLEKLITSLKAKVSDSIKRNRIFFETYADNILIISSGFREFIVPVVSEYGIKPQNVYANEFIFDEKGNIVGFRDDIPLAHNNGKVTQLASLNLQGEVYVIGDGYTDYEMRKAGLANSFYAFTENVVRESVTGIADHVTPSLDEFLYINKLPMAISYPKSRINVLILENIHPEAARIFKEEGYNIEIINSALDENELCEKIKNVSILCIRSKTNVTRKVIEHANKLMAIGAFCIGTNQIDLDACLERGIAVFNAPYSNTRSVVELAIGEIIMLMRNIPDKAMGMHAGKWDKSATGSYEVRGKKLGIIGYGNIGAQLSVVAEALGMDVYFYDIVDKLAIGKAQKCRSLKELLNIADVVSLHVDGRKQNRHLIGAAEFAEMKDGVIFLNLARGEVVDVEALVEALRSGKVRGAAVDVFPQEPKNNKEEFISPLRGMKNVLLTPHIGGSTMEAQINIAQFVPNKLIEYINTGNTFMSVNFPNIQLPVLENAHRLIHVHKNVSGILAQINNVLAKHQINIVGQYLKTNEKVGYVITDIDKAYNKDVIKDLKAIDNTIKFRVLY
ncbi:MAG: phosphoglycerate dehydrogenase [Cytophagales bacterium]|nr:phosphoglycerate dehydrogenase [Bernardetiaceae bacterium]MDW8203768.1 phosphoglycerate dehydrogenase [Cytophagales bacterium]